MVVSLINDIDAADLSGCNGRIRVRAAYIPQRVVAVRVEQLLVELSEVDVVGQRAEAGACNDVVRNTGGTVVQLVGVRVDVIQGDDQTL